MPAIVQDLSLSRSSTRTGGRRRSPANVRLLASLLATLAFSLAGVAQAAIPANQRQVLLDLYNSTGGANWTDSTGWLGAVGTECSWFGITCNGGETAVTDIQLVGNNLAGTLPAIGALTSLQYFNVGENSLTGPLPAISGLGSLQEFYAYQNLPTRVGSRSTG